jgi:hypothetical protein
MNIKLLKKIRKRYDWYFTEDKYPVLIDHVYKKVTTFDLAYCRLKSNYSLEDVNEKVKCTLDEWALRHMKEQVYSRYKIYYGDLYYRRINRLFKAKTKKYKEYGNTH